MKFSYAICIALALMAGPVEGQGTEPLAVRAQVAPGASYVGQGIEIRVGVMAEGERPEVVPPKVVGADLALVGTSFRPISASGIGDLVMERNQFLSRFRLIPRRAGLLVIPPFRARLGERAGASGPLRLAIAVPPLVGRPADFLGGVGTFEVAAEASPMTLRAGQEFEFRVRLTGPGALGATHGPNLRRFDQLPLALRIESLPTETLFEPPSVLFRYRLRPTRAGESVLPPVSVAAFDPKSDQYMTKVTAGVPVRVLAVPQFDPESLSYGPGPDLASPRTFGTGTIFTVAGMGLSLAFLVLIQVRRRRDRRNEPTCLARRLAGSFDPERSSDETARSVNDAIIDFLALAADRPRGALTPDEAQGGFLQAAGSADLAARAKRLVTQCDRIRFGRDDADAEALAIEARCFFNELSLLRKRKHGS